VYANIQKAADAGSEYEDQNNEGYTVHDTPVLVSSVINPNESLE
jgi:hypothetical protein